MRQRRQQLQAKLFTKQGPVNKSNATGRFKVKAGKTGQVISKQDILGKLEYPQNSQESLELEL